MAAHLHPTANQPVRVSLFWQSGRTLCGEVLEGGTGGRLHQVAMQRDPARRRPAAELQRPRPPVPHRDRHTGRRDQPQAEAGRPQLLWPGETAAVCRPLGLISGSKQTYGRNDRNMSRNWIIIKHQRFLYAHHKIIITKIMTAINPDYVLFHTVGFLAGFCSNTLKLVWNAKTSSLLFKCPFNAGQHV